MIDFLAAFGFGAATMAVVSGAVLLWLHRRLKAESREKRMRAAEAEAGREILAASPDGLFLWDTASGGTLCSPRLAVLLNMPTGTASTFDDVRSRFPEDGAAVLDDCVEALRRKGKSFDVELSTEDGQRRVRAIGVSAARPDGQPLADLLWMRDVTPRGSIVSAEGTTASGYRLVDLRPMLNALPIPTWLRDGNLDLVFFNRDESERAVPRASYDLAARARARGQSLTARREIADDHGAMWVDLVESPLPGWPGTIGFAIPTGDGAIVDSPADAPLHQILESLSTAVAVFGPDRRIDAFNQAYADLWRLDENWLETRPKLGEILDRLREQRRLPEVTDYRAFRKEQIRQFDALDGPIEMLLHLPNGDTLRSLVTPHVGGGLIFGYENVSDRLSLARSLKTLTAVQRETLDHLHEGVAVFGSDGRMRLSNPAFARLWNLSDADLAGGIHIGDFVGTIGGFLADAGNWPERMERTIARLMSREASGGRLERVDGSVLEYANVPLPDGAVLLSYVDVTDSAKVEQVLRQRADALDAANRLKSEFIANVSHEIRTPLTTLIGFAELLTQENFGPLNTRQKEYAQAIRDTGGELMAVVRDILDLATIEAGMMSLELDTVDVNELLNGTVGLVREPARQKDVAIELDSPADFGWIVADEKRLKQALFNLLSNAVRAAPQRGRVRLQARREDGDAILAVTGGPSLAGVADPDDQDAAGLGLALVGRFIELHDGRIEVLSSGRDTVTVVCRLPAGGDPSAPPIG